MKIMEILNKTNELLPKLFKPVGFIAAIVTIFAIANGYLQNSIHKQITDTEYINKISKSLRPYLLLNLDGNIIFDHGAYDFINYIKITPDTINFSKDRRFEIYIDFKKPMLYKPLIENLTPHDLIFVSSRLNNTGWIFYCQTGGTYEKYPNSESILRIELIF